jgi:hypothetical protein
MLVLGGGAVYFERGTPVKTRPGQRRRGTALRSILHEKRMKLKPFRQSSSLHSMSLLVILKNSCRKLHRQKRFNLIPFSYKIYSVNLKAFSAYTAAAAPSPHSLSFSLALSATLSHTPFSLIRASCSCPRHRPGVGLCERESALPLLGERRGGPRRLRATLDPPR